MVDTSMIEKPDGIIKVHYQDGSTEDIMSVIHKIDKMKPSKGIQKFSKQFEKSKRGLEELWYFTKYKIKYVPDSDVFSESQDVKTPESLIDIGFGDCKSKTIFINKVLQCLKIDYDIRYTGYVKGGDYGHVYTVAYIGKEPIIMDSVYDSFNREKPYQIKKDFRNMTMIRSIHGTELQADERSRLNELKDRQKYIVEAEPIRYNDISEGQAALLLSYRNLEIKEAFVKNSEDKRIITEAKNLINSALKGEKPSGCIDNLNQKLAADVSKFITQRYSAINVGCNVQKANLSTAIAMQENAKNQKNDCSCTDSKIGAIFPQELNLFADYWLEYDHANRPFEFAQNFKRPNPDPNGINLPDTSYAQMTALSSIMDFNENKLFYIFGLSSKYRGTYKDSKLGMQRAVSKALADGIAKMVCINNYDPSPSANTYMYPCGVNKTAMPFKVSFINQQSKDAFYDLMKLEVAVMSNFVNQTFAASSTKTPNGTISPNCFYPFLDDLAGISALNLNAVPASVLTKKTFQDQFLASCSIFSGVSRQNIRLNASNCCNFDNGETPQTTLRKVINLYNPNIGDFGISATIIAAIAAAVIGIISAIAAALDAAEKTKIEALKADNFAASQANFQSPSVAVMPNSLDWVGTGGGSGTTNTGGSGTTNTGGSGTTNTGGGKKEEEGSMLLPIGGAIALGLYLKSKKDSEKK